MLSRIGVTIIVCLALAVCMVELATRRSRATAAAGDAPAAKPDRPSLLRRYGPGRKIALLAFKPLKESSGIACSRIRKGVFWTHNDSGDAARVFAFDARGTLLGEFRLPGVRVRDMEDMASARIKGKSLLVCADVGDNDRRRRRCAIHIIEEPRLLPRHKTAPASAKLARTIRFRYADGPQDCEAVAVDPTERKIYLLSKNYNLHGGLYVLPLTPKDMNEVQVARPVARPGIALATGMDISPDGRRAIVVTYMAALEYERKPGETWGQAFARNPRWVPTPKRKQGESICYGPQARNLYLTSEGPASPLWEIPLLANPGTP